MSDNWQKVALAKPIPAERVGWRAAIVESPDGRVALAQGGGGQIVGEDLTWARAGKAMRAESVRAVRNERYIEPSPMQPLAHRNTSFMV